MGDYVSNRDKFMWNMLGGAGSAGASLLLSVIVNRILGGASGGIFAFAYANAQMMYTVGSFEVRSYQCTDVCEKYSFNTYFSFRLFSCLVMIAVTGIYIGISGFTSEKSIVVFLVMLFKAAEAFADVLAGRFQQKDRIDLSGKLYFMRIAVSTMVFALLAALSKNLVAASFGIFFASFIMIFINDCRYVFAEDKKSLRPETRNIIPLLKDVTPLFIGAFIIMYISNAPKYAINIYFSDEMQNIYNILFMPAFVINMFSLFVFMPMLTNMSLDWNSGHIKKMGNTVIKIYGIIFLLTIIALIGTWFFGIFFLSVLYGVDFSEYRNYLMYVMVTGGISAIFSFSNQVITIMRKQKILLFGYAVSFLYAYVVSGILVRKFGIIGAILTYGSSMGFLVFVCLIIIVVTFRERRRMAWVRE